MTNNKWQILNNNCQMGNDKCQMGNEKWQMGNEKWQMTNMLRRSTPPPRPLTLRQDRTIPDWIIGRSVLTFFVAFVLCTIVWGYPMELRYAVISSLSVLLFFYGSYAMSRNGVFSNEHTFIRNVFFVGLILRLLWMMYCYFFFNLDYYGYIHGDDSDTGWYMRFAKDIAQWLLRNSEYTLSQIIDLNFAAIDDTGYPMWLGIIYAIFGVDNDVFIPFVLKCIINAYCAVCAYRITKRHFGEGAARIAALFVALNPNMIYWCGNMFKESEMMFLCCLCVDLADSTFSSGQRLTFRGLLPALLVGMAIFFFRSALAVVLFLAMFAHIVMASGKVMSVSKKIIAGVLVVVTLLLSIGDQLRSQTQYFMDSARSDAQRQNMEWRTQREGGNEFAKYAGKAVFAPLIFTIPFPTFNVALEGQILQQQLSGGNFIKNILSYFVIWVMIMMLISGAWRQHVFLLAYTGGYLTSLVLSNYAHSSRFHMPIWPMLMLFAAYGIQLAKTNRTMRRWFPLVLMIEVIACLAWNWFKLAGRGMI